MALSTLSAPATDVSELDPNEMLSPRQVAKELGADVVSASTVLAYARTGKIPAVRVSNRYKIRRSDIHLMIDPTGADAYLDSLIKGIVDNFPKLNADQKSQLGRLLAPAA